MLFSKKEQAQSSGHAGCCGVEVKKCPGCGLEFKEQVPARCPRCNMVMPHRGCEGCKHKH
ncbi:MAG TPA: hypothetical protein VNU93_09225 [Verrucomicrobiae bacterium]|nr:hypothetical protein [Verrucomicrobiae bacterium]